MRLVELNRAPKPGQLRMFGVLWFPLFCAALSLILWRATDSWFPLYVAGGAAGVSLLLGAVKPTLLKPLFVGLMIASFPVGWVVSHVLMGLMYYALITPVGLVMRLVGYDPMSRQFDRSADSYWRKLPPPPPNDRYFRQY
ncbi:MAG: hypothetical protein IT464_11960 [Planctomycetes bacterium]|nr:hypothetical protein [Planctomycetota bacterium]